MSDYSDDIPMPPIPHVSTSPTGSIVVELNTLDARTLADVLAHYAALTTHPSVQTPAGYDVTIWHHTLIELHTEAAKQEPVEVDNVTNVPLIRFPQPAPNPRLAVVPEQREGTGH